MTKPCDVILRKDNKINNLKNIYIFVIVLSKLPFTTLKKINKYNFGSLKLGLQFHLHMCDLVLLPVKAFHLILLQFFSGFHVLVVITLHRRYMTTSPYCLVGSETVRHVPRTQIYKKRCSYRVVFQLALVQVHDVGAHAVEEVLRMGDQYQNSFKSRTELNVRVLFTCGNGKHT